MASPTAVNSQITDAVTQSNVLVLASAPAQAMGSVFQVMAHATGLAMQNAVSHQQRMNALTSAITAQGVNLIYGMPTAANAHGTVAMFDGNAVAALLAELRAELQMLQPPKPGS